MLIFRFLKTINHNQLLMIHQSSVYDSNLKWRNQISRKRIEVSIQRTISTHKYCCLCSATTNLSVIPEEVHIQSYIKIKIHIPTGNRCCRHYLIKNRFYDKDLGLLKVFSNSSSISTSELTKMIESFYQMWFQPLWQNWRLQSFQETTSCLHRSTWENIILLRDMMTSMLNRQTRIITQTLVIFLFELCTGNSNAILASILQLENEQLVLKYSSAIVKSLQENVLPFHFGLTSSNRNNLIQNHTTKIERIYLLITKMLICDETYARHQKSTNDEFQRKSFSG